MRRAQRPTAVRTREDIYAAARAAGLTVDTVERVPVAGGGTALAARMSFDDPWAAARLLFILSDQDASDPTVRAWALEILSDAAAAMGESAGPTISPALRDELARSIHAHVQSFVKFVHEPEETFQSAPVTMQTGAGDCDDHARLVYALAVAGGVPAKLVFFEEPDDSPLPTVLWNLGAGTVPVHVVAQLQDADGTWQWAETTVDADYGEEPHAAVDRLELGAGSDPLAQGIGSWGFVTPGDVASRKDQVSAEVEATDVDVVNCASLDAGTLAAWNLFVASWRSFDSEEPSFFNAGGQARQTTDYVDQLAEWQTRLAAKGCTLTAAPIPAQDTTNPITAITIVAGAAAVVAGALAVREIVKAVRS
jgi:hypothetical protein